MTDRKILTLGVLALVALALTSDRTWAGEGVRLLCGFEPAEFRSGKRPLKLKEDGELLKINHVHAALIKKHATQGEYAGFCDRTRGEFWRDWKGLKKILDKDRSGEGNITGPYTPYFPPRRWTFQRSGDLWFHGTTLRTVPTLCVYGERRHPPVSPDWSGFETLRFDIRTEGCDAAIVLYVQDGNFRRTARGRFDLQAGKTVTCEFPLAAMAAAAELDLAKVARYRITLQDAKAAPGPKFYLDNVRLAAKGAGGGAKLPVVKMSGEVRPFTRKLIVPPGVEVRKETLVRKTGPVKKLGPVLIEKPMGGGTMPLPDDQGKTRIYLGSFGGHGATYFGEARRGVVAWDNNRIMFLTGGSRVYGYASFDGGATWGGLSPGRKEPTCIWKGSRNSGSSSVCADASGTGYHVGAAWCDAYGEGTDIYVQSVRFTGEQWVPGPKILVDHNLAKCPSMGRAFRLKSGRLWVTWSDGFGGRFAKYSDDGMLFHPVKDPRAKPPRPEWFPEKGEPLPGEQIVEPAFQVPGPLLVPYKDTVATFDRYGTTWSAFENKAWSEPRKTGLDAKASTHRGYKRLNVSETYFEDGTILLLARQKDKLLVKKLSGESWSTENLPVPPEQVSAITRSNLTRSGKNVYAFYVTRRKEGEAFVHRIHMLKRTADGRWSKPEEIAEDKEYRINHVTTPVVSPPDYVPLFWDNATPKSRKLRGKLLIRFLRIPNE